ncbi:phospholipid-transporting ATPase IF-like isoform X2 [Littorina saxatilis]|uniref:phospholipid-transporting ATPase IF-like isoform X2 n=1 Tax=Littorina saxatilis TaxID=31220 RepID=UPI0038B600FB
MLRCMKHDRPETRTVHVGNRASAALGDEAYVPEKFIDNRVISYKYTLLTFLPKNLFEQFRRIANFYFLVVGIIQLLIDTPVTPITSILPLVFVISVTAIKQGYEDWLRHKADRDVNNRKSTVVEGGSLKDCKSMHIKVGNIVRVQINEEFPCDLVMLSSSDPEGKCYVTTANLDGETNLKTHVCVPETRSYQKDSDFDRLEAKIECEQPMADLYRFVGNMHVVRNGEKVVHSLSTENVLLRGARLKNTTYVFGCAIYTGQETKMALNSKFKKTKFSRVEWRMNTLIILFILVLFTLSSLFTGLKHWYTKTFDLPWYVPPGKDDLTASYVVEDFLAFMVLFNYIIPISLYVTVEMQKFIGSMFFSWDSEMYDPRTDLPAQANTSDLNEELGQVEYLFTDKTGTLTENMMCFRLCSIQGAVFEEIDGQLCPFPSPGQLQPSPVTNWTDKMFEFFMVLVLCHTVRVDNVSGGDAGFGASTVYSSDGQDYDYHASSPDEKALVEACRRYGIIYHGIHDELMEVTFPTETEMRRYKVLHILDFSPTRRCMSIILKNDQGEIYLLCKGAELAVFNKIAATDRGDLPAARTHVDQFAVLGLRTLAIANRKLTAEEYQQIEALLTEAKTSLQDREQKVEQVYNEIEQELTLLGITAVEDRLQEDVPETITALRHAGIKVWVLTGDKEETAVNISHSTGHFHSGMVELRLTNITSSEQSLERMTDLQKTVTMAENGVEHVLIVSGQSLTFALADHRNVLLQLCQTCVAVLCCRMSPIQKAQVVRLIKQSPREPVTAAIGDGANDVSMIQEADVGLGIMGKEGRQAVQNSDYAFGKFRFLSRALLLHGHYYYVRLSTLVQYCFYKNVALITPQAFYQIFSSFSAQTVFDPFFLLFYNITFTSLPILIYGIFEQHVHREKLLHKPTLYRRISRNSNLSWMKFTQWSALGLWHGSVCFFGGFLLFQNDVSVEEDGKLYGLRAWGSIVHIAVVFVVNFKLALMTYYWSWPIVAAFAFSAVGNLALSFVVTGFLWPSWATDTNSFYWVQIQLMSSLTVWLFFLVIVSIALLPDLLIRIVHDIKNHRAIYRPCCSVGGASTIFPAEFKDTEHQGEGQQRSAFQSSLS